MKKLIWISLLSFLLIVIALGIGKQNIIQPVSGDQAEQETAVTSDTEHETGNTENNKVINSMTETGDKSMKTIYFAGGCFWGMERLMSVVPGVEDAQSGYANGEGDNPSYQQVTSGKTGYRETVKVTYDENIIGTRDLMRLFFSTIDPTVSNRQGNDVGSQYQTGVYWEDAEDETIVREFAETEKTKHRSFRVEIEPLTSYWPAEEYHQDYLVKNPFGYCHIGPADFDMARKLVKE